MKLRIAMVGVGMARWLYGPAFRTTDQLKLVALVDPDASATADWIDQYGDVPVYADYDEFLDKGDADAVLIATPPHLHCEMTEKGARAGKHVYCEKPMARTIAECDRMIRACRNNNVALMIGFQLRFEKGCALAKRLIESGDLGEVRSVLADRSFYEKVSWGYRAELKTLGGILQDHGAHSFDICRWWLGDVKRVSAEIRIFKGAILEELAYATLLHENHAISCHRHSKTTHLPVKEEFVIDGENASLHLLSPRSFIGSSTETFIVTLHEFGMSARDITPLGDPNMETEIRDRWSYKLELEEFARAVREGRTPSPSGEDGRKNIEIINAAYVSAWRGQTVTLPLTESPDLERVFREIAAEQEA